MIKQEQEYMEKIEEAKKISKIRSGSVGRIKVFAPKQKNKDMKNRTKSSYKVSGNNGGGESYMSKYHKKLKESKKQDQQGSNNIQKVNANEI